MKTTFLSTKYFSILICLFLTSEVFSEKTFEDQMNLWARSEFENPLGGIKETPTTTAAPQSVRLSLKDAIMYVLQNNVNVKNAVYDLAKADTPFLQNQSKYVWILNSQASILETRLPFNFNNFFSGTKIQNNRYSVGVDKRFKTGTNIDIDLSYTRFDSNALENQTTTPAQFSFLGIPPLYTGNLGLTLSQELYKYSFGKNEDNLQKILQLNVSLKEKQLVNVLSNLVASILVQYWSLSIQRGAIATFEELLKNTKEIRDLTIRKQSLGLSDAFEINQWNASIYRITNQLENAKQDKIVAERDLSRILGVDVNSSIESVTDLEEKMPSRFSLQKDIAFANQNRIDLLSTKNLIEIGKYSLENAQMEERPSVTAKVTYNTLSQSLLSSQAAFAYMEPRNWIGPNAQQVFAELRVTYPLGDPGIQGGIRDAKLNLESLNAEETRLKLEIKDSLTTLYQTLKANEESLQDAQKARNELKKYYQGLLSRFKQGSYNANDLKRALDSLVQSELSVVQAKINLNINIIRYDIAMNGLFAKYNIDVYQILNTALTKGKENMLQ